MEFFEKAHVARDKNMKKPGKSEELIKKRLKQMLYGYKSSDNEIIKNAEHITDDESDSISVNGFSDLSITNSTNEEENVPHVLTCSTDSVTISNMGEITLNNSLGNESSNDEISLNNSAGNEFTHDVSGDNDNLCNKFINTEQDSIEDEQNDSISECNDDSNLLSEISLDADDNLTMESEDNLSFLKSSENTDAESDESEPFDVDDELASKILENLGKKRNSGKGKKRKHEELESNNTDDILFLGPYKGKLGKAVTGDHENEVDIEDTDVTDTITPEKDFCTGSMTAESNSIIDSFISSPPFVSITASDMSDQNFNEILGEYKHSTIRNLSSESHNLVSSTINSDVFSMADINVTDVQLDTCEGIINEAIDDSDVDGTMENEINKSFVKESSHKISQIIVKTDDSTSQVVNDEINSSQTSIQLCENINVDDTLNSEQIEQNDNSDTEVSHEKLEDFPVRVYCRNDSCILVLKHPTEIFIHGKVKVKAMGGKIEIFGYTLKDKFYNVFAPYCNYAQYLKTIENSEVYYGLFGNLTKSGLSVAEAEEIVTTISNQDGVVLLKPLNTGIIEFIENNFSASDLFNKTRKNVDKCFKEASKILGCSLYLSKPSKRLENNIYWNQALKCAFKKSSRGILCGGKGVGKSTTLRYFVNKLLVHGPVLVIDLDPGQCEFTVAGNLSVTVVTEPLLGPNFTHLKRPEMMLNIGMINVMDNPARYVAAVDELITYCSTKEHFKNIPWIVNTMGMCNTLGLKFISFIIIRLQPTFLLQLDTMITKKRFEHPLNPSTIRKIYNDDYQYDALFKNITFPDELDYSFYVSLDSESSKKFNLSIVSRDERYLNFLAYFGELVNLNNDDLLGITPYEVNLKDLKIGVNVRINEDTVTRVLNGKIVALCQYSNSTSQLFTLKDKPLLCYGHGLVRGVDVEKEILYIITPTPIEKLSLVNTVVYADWVPEIRGQEQYLPPGIHVPYRTSTEYQKRQLMHAPRRRFNPLQLIKMSRKS